MSRVNGVERDQIEKARQAFAAWVCQTGVSPRSVCAENGAFRQLMDTINPSFGPLLDFNSLEKGCLKVYKEQVEKVKEKFAKLDAKISLSVDSLMFEKKWVSLDFFSCVRAHFIDNDWKLQNWVVKYSGEELYESEAVLNSLKEWSLDSKLMSFCVGETDIVDCVMEEIQGRNNELLMNGQFFHAQCSSDVISRMVQKGFEMIYRIIYKVKLLAWSKSEPLWYLTSCKLRRALALEAMGEFSDESIRRDNDVPSEEEWGNVRTMCKIADRIYEITEGLYLAKGPITANLFLPHLVEIRSYLAEVSASSDPFEKAVAHEMLKVYTSYWNDMHLMLAISAFMDPRYKMKLIGFCFSKLNCDDDKSALVLETIRKLFDGYAVETEEKRYLLSDSSSEFEDEDEEDEEDEQMSDMREASKPCHNIRDKPCHNIRDKLSLLSEYCSLQSGTDEQPRKSDLDLYLEEPVLAWTDNFSVLKWWKDNCSKYPLLSKMARDWLAIPMTLATSYDAFYTEPRQADTTVLSLRPKLRNALICTRSWKLPINLHD